MSLLQLPVRTLILAPRDPPQSAGAPVPITIERVPAGCWISLHQARPSSMLRIPATWKSNLTMALHASSTAGWHKASVPKERSHWELVDATTLNLTLQLPPHCNCGSQAQPSRARKPSSTDADSTPILGDTKARAATTNEPMKKAGEFMLHPFPSRPRGWGLTMRQASKPHHLARAPSSPLPNASPQRESTACKHLKSPAIRESAS